MNEFPPGLQQKTKTELLLCSTVFTVSIVCVVCFFCVCIYLVKFRLLSGYL